MTGEGKVRRQRTLTESLLSIVLALEAVLVFFVTLAAFGLKALPPPVAFGGGAALLVALLLASRLQRTLWGVGLGAALQVVLFATGVVLTAMYFVAVAFVALWVFCFVRGRQVDRARAASESERGEKA